MISNPCDCYCLHNFLWVIICVTDTSDQGLRGQPTCTYLLLLGYVRYYYRLHNAIGTAYQRTKSSCAPCSVMPQNVCSNLGLLFAAVFLLHSSILDRWSYQTQYHWCDPQYVLVMADHKVMIYFICTVKVFAIV